MDNHAPSKLTPAASCSEDLHSAGDPGATGVAVSSCSFSLLPSPLAIFAALFDRLGHHEPAATISGFAMNPLTRTAFPEINTTITHLRDVLGDPVYESLARQGETMSTAEMVTYAYDQIDQARAELEHRLGIDH